MQLQLQVWVGCVLCLGDVNWIELAQVMDQGKD
jgi:hypothetical protein